MATAYKVKVSASDTGLLKFKQDEATAQKVSDLLQQDLEVSIAEPVHRSIIIPPFIVSQLQVTDRLYSETPRLLQRLGFPRPRKLEPLK